MTEESVAGGASDSQIPEDVRKALVDAENERREQGIDEPLPKMPVPRDFTGKLPDELTQDWIKSVEEFIKLWKDSQDFSLQLPYLVDLGWEEPFFGSLSRRIAKLKTADIPTAGVRVVQGMVEMLWNPIFFKHKIKKEQVKGVIKHELYHVILEHITQRRQVPHILWNAATDCAINSLIPRRELPDFCLLPGELYRPPKAPPTWKPSILAKIIKDAPKEKSSEWYMNHFLQQPEVQQAMQNARQKAQQRVQGAGMPMPGAGSQGQGQQDPNGQPQPGQGQGDPNDPNQQQQGGGGQDADRQARREDRAFNDALEEELYGRDGGQFDDHNIWDSLSDADRDMMRDYIRDIFRDCVREAERHSNGWGTVPESIRSHLKKLISKEVDWRELISQFIGRARSTKTTSSIKRINRRVPWDFPGRKRAYSAKPAIAIDESGSMDQTWVELLFAEVSNLGALTEYDIIPFDYTVAEDKIQTIRRGQQPKLERVRSGGTDFSAPVKYVNDHPGKYDCLFILTDGGCGSPIKCDIPMAYILVPGQQLMFKPAEGVPVIQMTDTRKKAA